MLSQTWKIGDVVEKISGYRWPGVVRSVFTTIAGETRIVVECTVPEVAGALHIYSPSQLRRPAETPSGLEIVGRHPA
jgi:hypothetical protein